ncbi:MAG: hypothetical protein CM15mP3_01200 [Candidatus Poseidoniales archaeon]|nr:MAG: hypothetical protein CM15mP3_01200 [Candidatus Poseidoniales archaeon]
MAEEDYDNMTPFQKLVVSWSQMDVNVQDLDGDEFPDSIVWEYELLLNTTEGLQWQAKMETDYPYISNGFDDFNNFDIELLTILRIHLKILLGKMLVKHCKNSATGQQMRLLREIYSGIMIGNQNRTMMTTTTMMAMMTTMMATNMTVTNMLSLMAYTQFKQQN